MAPGTIGTAGGTGSGGVRTSVGSTPGGSGSFRLSSGGGGGGGSSGGGGGGMGGNGGNGGRSPVIGRNLSC